MSGEIELLPLRALSGVIGHDAAGLAGREDVVTQVSRILGTADPVVGAALRNGGGGALMNARPAHFRRIRTKIAQVRRNVGNGTIIGIGDSIMRGTSAEAGAAGGFGGVLAQLATLLAGRGIAANAENVFGYGGYEQAFASFDSRIAVSGSFNQTAGGGIRSGGGRIFQATATGGLVYTPVANVVSFDIYYIDNGASFTYALDGGTQTTVATGNTSALKRMTVSAGALGPHSLGLAWVSGTVYILGIVGYDPAAKRVDLLNFGWHGSRSQDWIDGSSAGGFWNYDRLTAFAGADLVIWGLGGTNDWSNSVPVATFSANLATLIGKIKALAPAPDILLLTPPPSGFVAGAYADQQKYVDAVIAAAYAADIPVFDRWRSWGDEATMRALGALNTDAVHPTRTGHMLDAERLLGCLLTS